MAKPITPAEATAGRVTHETEISRINGLLRMPWTAREIRVGRRVYSASEEQASEIAGLFRAGGWQVTYTSSGLGGYFRFKPTS